MGCSRRYGPLGQCFECPLSCAFKPSTVKESLFRNSKNAASSSFTSKGLFDKETVAGHKGSLNDERAYVPVFDTMCHSDDTPVLVHTFDGNDASIAPIMIRPDKHFTFSGFGPAVSEGSLFAGEYDRASVTIPGASPAGLTPSAEHSRRYRLPKRAPIWYTARRVSRCRRRQPGHSQPRRSRLCRPA